VAWTLATLATQLANAAAFGTSRFGVILVSNFAYGLAGIALLFLLARPGELQTAMLSWVGALAVGALVCGIGLLTTEGARYTAPPNARPLSPLKDLREYAANTWVGSLSATLLWTRGEIGVLQALVPSSQLAYYGAATTINGLILQAVNLIQGAVAPYLSHHWVVDDRRAIARMIQFFSNVVFFVSTAGAAAVALFGHELVLLLFGPAFTPAILPLAIVAIGATSAGTGVINLIVQFATNGRFQRNSNLIGAAALLCLTALLAPFFGITGAAFARTITGIGVGLALIWCLSGLGYRSLMRIIAWRWCAAIALVLGLALAEWAFDLAFAWRAILWLLALAVLFQLFIGRAGLAGFSILKGNA
jgi:O-antigen/teichoic acid export membrane protein